MGSRIAQALEARPEVELVIGVDTSEPLLPLQHTEFVKADSSLGVLRSVMHAASVDTVVHAGLVVNSTRSNSESLYDINVIGTMNVLAAAEAAESSIRKLVVKTSTLVYGTNFDDPYFYREGTHPTHPPTTPVERSLVEVDALVQDFADDNTDIAVTSLRLTEMLGEDRTSTFSAVLRMPVVPEIFGFDPRLQFIDEDDAVRAIEFATLDHVPGTFNVAGPGTITWSEACTILGKRRVAIPPLMTEIAVRPLRTLGRVDIPSDVLRLLRYGRGVDTTAYVERGFEYRYTTRETVDAFARLCHNPCHR